jgi:Ca2+:H+ antiporter
MGDFNMREFPPQGPPSDLGLARLQRKSERLLIVLPIDSLKREARREAWYGQSSNPFRRVWTDRGANATQNIENQSDSQAVGRISSEPPPGSRLQGGAVPQWSSHKDAISLSTLAPGTTFNSVNEMPELTGAQAHEQSSEDTVVESQSTGHPPGMASRLSTSKKSLKHKPFTLGNQLRATIFNSWINLLLIAAPVGIAMHFVNVSPVAVFVINFIAIIPLAALLSYATEEIALRVGETLGGLLNATFGFVHVAISTESC